MANDTHRDLLKRFRAIKSERTTVEQTWDTMERFVAPGSGRMFNDQASEHSQEWGSNREIYDSTAVMAAQNLAASIHGSMTSPTLKWFDLRFRNEELNESKAAVNWLQDAGAKVHYELQDSNFDLEISKAYQDLVVPGTTMLMLEEGPKRGQDWGGLEFTSVPLKEVFFEPDHRGRVLRFYRRLEWTPQQLISKFGIEGVPQSILDREKHGNTEKVLVLFCVYPRNNRILKWGEKVTPGRRPLSYCYLLEEGCELLGKEGGYYDMPAFVGRWSVQNSSIWGRSPSMDAIWDVISLNQMCKDDLRAKAKQIDPPLLAEERTVVADLNLDPGTISVVRTVAGIAAAPGPDGMSIHASDVAIARKQSDIRNYYMVDRIDFPDMQAQPMTATEAQIRYERMQRYMGATLAHLRNDMLNPAVERVFNMLVRAGEIEIPPEEVVAAGAVYDIEYLGSLTRAQQVDEVAAIERTMMAAAGVAEVFPDGLDVIDAPKAIRTIGRKMNAPADIMRDQGEVEKKQKERQQQQAAMQEAALAEQEGNAMQAVGAGQEAINGPQEQATPP